MRIDRSRSLLTFSLAAAVVAITTGATIGRSERQQPPQSLTSSDWLGLLPEGETKQRFILDCTGCHQFDARITRPNGAARSEADFTAATQRMLGFAGATTGFPVIAHDRDAASTAKWLAAYIGGTPKHRPPTNVVTVRDAVTEFDMPEGGDLPHDVAIQRDGRIVVTGMFTHRMYVLDPATKAVETVPIPVDKANPRAVEIDSAGAWWVALGGPQSIVRYTPSTKQWSTFPIGFYPHSVALGSGGAWANGHFTRSPELIARVDASSGAIEKVTIPSHPTLGSKPGGPIPYEIRVSPDGRVWGSELGGNRLFAYSPSTKATKVYDMPSPHSGPRRFDFDAQGILWIPAYATNELVRLDPRTEQFTRIKLPAPDAVPYVVRVDQQTGRVWIGTGAADIVLAYDPPSQRFTLYPLPSRGAMVRHLAIDPRTHDVWVAYGASPGVVPARVARVRVGAGGAGGDQGASAPTAFLDVTVIPMDRQRTIPNQTVVVRDGKIAWMGPAKSASIPEGAVRVDGRGKFLMPGLAEMHAHVPPNEPPAQVLNDIFFLYIANGVTTIRGMLGSPYQLGLRDRLARGELLGPTLYVGAPSLNGNTAPDPATGARLVREHKRAGYDLLKLHPGLSRATYDSIVVVARSVGITWGGHVSQDVGIEHTLETKQSTVDHLDQYVEGAVSHAMKRRIASPTDTVRIVDIWGDATEARLAALARRTKEAGVWNVPTMHLWESLYSTETGEQMAQREEMRYASRAQVQAWVHQKKNRTQLEAQRGVTGEEGARLLRLRRSLLKSLADAGAPLLMGTDSPQMFNVPGFALHRELAIAVAAGLTPYQVLESGTRNVARYAAQDLRLDGRFGTVAVGHRADLVLLDANPLEGVGNLTKRSGVMVRGRWVSAAEIEKGLAELSARMGAS